MVHSRQCVIPKAALAMLCLATVFLDDPPPLQLVPLEKQDTSHNLSIGELLPQEPDRPQFKEKLKSVLHMLLYRTCASCRPRLHLFCLDRDKRAEKTRRSRKNERSTVSSLRCCSPLTAAPFNVAPVGPHRLWQHVTVCLSFRRCARRRGVNAQQDLPDESSCPGSRDAENPDRIMRCSLGK